MGPTHIRNIIFYLTNKLNPRSGAASRGVPDKLKILPNDAEICKIQLRMFTLIGTKDVYKFSNLVSVNLYSIEKSARTNTRLSV